MRLQSCLNGVVARRDPIGWICGQVLHIVRLRFTIVHPIACLGGLDLSVTVGAISWLGYVRQELGL